jgi:hypothetical protein
VTFDQSAGDRSLAEVLVSACARPASHTATAQALHMSRAVYFRRLRTATERVAEHLTL